MDATQAIIDSLKDPKRWVIRRGVPVFCQHVKTKTLSDGTTKEITVDVPKLHEIVQQYQRLQRESGVVPRITFGHTNPDPATPENQQPKPRGWALNWRVGEWRGKPAIIVDEYLHPEDEAEAATYPYRSAEYYDGRREITGIALLRRDPELDLGIVANYKRQDESYYYVMENAMPDAPAPNPATTQPTAPPNAAAGDNDFNTKADCYMKSRFPNLDRMHKDAGARYAAEAAAAAPATPGPLNATIPAPAPAPGKPEAPEHMRRQQDPDLYARLDALEKAKADSDREAATLRLEVSLSKAEQQVARLEAAGFYFKDREKEKEKLAAMTPEQRQEREAEVVQCYQRDPTKGEMIQIARDTLANSKYVNPSANNGKGGLTQLGMDAALRYQRQQEKAGKPVPWEEAISAVMSGKVAS